MPLKFRICLCLLLLISALARLAFAGDDGRWAFDPGKDAFSPDALLDLRALNEKEAGLSGFVKRSPDGNDFALGNGQPVRFWAINTGVQSSAKGDLAAHAKFLAKRGVNMVRFHGNLSPKGEASKITDFNEKNRDECWRLVAAMKKEGIYTTISPYWATPVKVKASWGVAGPANQSAMPLLFWDKTLQEGYKSWLKALFAEKNPHTGIPLAQDSSVAIIQLQNEDSVLFWTMQGISKEQQTILGKLFGEWLAKKYGSLEKARAAWNGETYKGDNSHIGDQFEQGIVGQYIVWEFTQKRDGGKARRLADQLQFFGETMHAFNTMIGKYLREELGCKQLVNAGNWKTADPIKLEDVERWSYTANEVIGVNRYYGGVHAGKNSGWCIDKGDQFTDESALLNCRALPVNLKQVQGFPTIVSESSWVPPLSRQSEGPFLVSVYQSLTGVDAFYWFATGVNEWQAPASANGFIPAIGKWVCATPELLGQFPAAALMFRKGYIKQGETAVLEERALSDLWARKTPIIAEDKSFDPNRDVGDIGAQSNIKAGVNPLAFLVGPVVVNYGGDPAKSKVADLSKYIDESKKTVKSITGEIELNFGKGVCVLDAPKAQGVSGFLKDSGGVFKMSAVEIKSGNTYATILAVSLDDKPLGASGKVLLQIGTVARPTDWQEKEVQIKGKEGTYAGFEVVSFGKAPWRIANTDATITIKNGALTKATLLDSSGMAAGAIPVEKAAGALTVKLPANAMYVVVE